MSSIVRQQSFKGGAVAREFDGRTHDPRYGISLRTCKNFLPTVHGALLNRAGTSYLGAAGSSAPRFEMFVFSDTQALVLEFKDSVVRFWTVNGQVLFGGVPYEVATPYVQPDLQRLDIKQAGDVVTITHPSYQPRELTRISNTNWTLSTVPFTPPFAFKPGGVGHDQDFTGGASVSRGWSALTNYAAGQYAFTVVDSRAYIALQPNTNKEPSVSPAHWAAASDTSRPEKKWKHAVTLVWKDAYGTLRESLAASTPEESIVRYTDRPVLTAWIAPAAPGFNYSIVSYEIYAGRSGVFGWIGSVDGATLSFKDDGQAPDFGIQPPKGANPFKIADGVNTENTTKWPGAVTYHEQRRVLARSDAKPSTFFGSQLGDIQSHDVNDPPQESDAYEWRLAAEKLEEIRTMKSFGRLCLFTGQGEWSAQGKDGGGITPSNIEVRRHSTHGSSYLGPLEVEHALLFVTAKGNHVRDFFFDYSSNGYVGSDVSEYARHFFRGYTITSWAHQRVPYHIAWLVRSDGVLLSLTYDRATQTVGWAEHETDGQVKAVACIPDGTEDVLLLAVRRAGGTYVEKMASRDYIPDQRLACFLDSSLTRDGRNTGAVTMKVTGASFNALDLVTVEASVASFALTDVDDQVVIIPNGYTVLNVDGTVNRVLTPVRIAVTAYTDTTHVTGRLEAPLDPLYQATPTTDWGFARDTLTGIDHLDGEQVTVLADGVVQGPFTVASGEIGPLAPPAVIATAGLPYTSDAELLDIGADAIKPNVKSVARAIFEVVGSRGIHAGVDFDHLRPAKLRQVSDGFGVPALVTDQVAIAVNAGWETGGRACVRQSDPLPLTITAAMREVEVGGRG